MSRARSLAKVPRSGRCRALVWGIGLAMVGEVHAAPPPPRAHLIYVREAGAEHCPDEEAVRAAVASRLGYNPFSLYAPRTVTLAVRRESADLVAHIELSDALGEVSGKRELRSPDADCADLSSAMELAVALAIDPLGALHADAAPPPGPPADADSLVPDTLVQPPVEPAPPQPPSPPIASPLPPIAPRRLAPPVGEPLRLRLGGGGLLALGTSPSVAAGGFELHFSLRKAAWSVGIEARGDLPGTAADGGADGPGRVAASLVVGWVVACLHFAVRAWRTGQVEILGCGLLGAGAQFGTGQGHDTDSLVTEPYVAVGVRAGVEIPIARRLSLVVHGDLEVPTLRLDLQVTEQGQTRTAWSAPAVSGALGVEALVHLR